MCGACGNDGHGKRGRQLPFVLLVTGSILLALLAGKALLPNRSHAAVAHRCTAVNVIARAYGDALTRADLIRCPVAKATARTASSLMRETCRPCFAELRQALAGFRARS